MIAMHYEMTCITFRNNHLRAAGVCGNLFVCAKLLAHALQGGVALLARIVNSSLKLRSRRHEVLLDLSASETFARDSCDVFTAVDGAKAASSQYILW